MGRGFLATKKHAAITGLAIAVVGFGIFGISKANASFIQDCTVNSIIKCGEPSASAFVQKVRTNGPNHDLQAIYARFGLEPAMYDQFVANAVPGVAKMDGTVEVNGQTVATNAWSIGRTHFSYTTPYVINGKTYWKAMDTQVLQQNLPVMVMFDGHGRMLFAVINSCGNPVKAVSVTPKFSCDMLNKTKVSGKPNTFDFTTNATAARGAKVVKVVYDFGDGSSNETVTSLSQKVRHTFSKPGTWNVRVTVTVSLPGNQTTQVTSANCQTTITVAQPFFQCVSLTPFTIDKEKRQFRFIVKTNQGNGATLKSASFDFGDNSTASNIKPTKDNIVETEHTFANDGNFAITATVNFSVMHNVQSVNCVTNISPKVTPPPPPPQLVNTGPGTGGTIGLFTITSVIAGFGYKYFVLRKARN